MKKIILSLFILIIMVSFPNYVFSYELNDIQLELRDYDEITLPVGTFIAVTSMQDISTETCPEGYKVKFIATNDLYMHDTNIIPRNTEFFGYIEKINEPVVGTNAALKVKVTKMVMTDGFELPIQAYLYNSNNNTFGGELTPPAEWVKMPHYQSRFQGIAWNHRSATLQVRPGGKRSMGKHTTIPSGEQLIVILTKPLPITHTISN